VAADQRHHFTPSTWTTRTFVTRQKKIPASTTKDLCTVRLCLAVVIDPYFFENNEGIAVTVKPDHHTKMLRNLLASELGWQGLNLHTLWFQQDRATAHIESNYYEYSVADVPGKCNPTEWGCSVASKIPICPRDYFLSGFLKSKFSIIRSRTNTELKQNIREYITAIPVEMTQSSGEFAFQRTTHKQELKSS
jgi:hypothetical protein